jgi:hypothetical protein
MKKRKICIVALLLVVKYNRAEGTEQMTFPGTNWEDVAAGTPNDDWVFLAKKCEK